jgi:adenosylhomocysteinase
MASRARGLGAMVSVVEVNPIRGLEATMDGFRVVKMMDAAKFGDIFITTTGNIRVIRKEHFREMRDGTILCNAGHFNVEIDIRGLAELSRKRREVLNDVEEFQFKDGKRIYLLGQGRLINLAGERSLGHPMEIMDMSFSLQVLSAEYLVKEGKKLSNHVYEIPREIDRKVAGLKLKSLHAGLEKLTPEQIRYGRSWKHST